MIRREQAITSLGPDIRPNRVAPELTALIERRGKLGMIVSRNVLARDPIVAWVTDYNTARPHSALGYQSPAPDQRNRPFRCTR